MIVIISRIKNSADIIESWIRANSAVADKFVLIDNHSSDGTVEILKLLKAEGFDIEILNGKVTEIQRDQMNFLLDYVEAHYQPDWVLPLDDDEILASDRIQDIKGYLSSLPADKEFKVRWRVYTMRGNENQNEVCPLKRLGYCFINNQLDFPTVLLTNRILNEGAVLCQGNHSLKKCDYPVVFLDDLYLAHYPVRSKEQMISKFLVGWSNYLTHPLSENMNTNSYWKRIYEDFKRDRNCINDKYLHSMIGLYRQKIYVDNVDEIVWKPINVAEDALLMKYSNSDVDWLYNYMCNTEDIAKNLAQLKSQKGEKPFDYDFYTGKQAF